MYYFRILFLILLGFTLGIVTSNATADPHPHGGKGGSANVSSASSGDNNAIFVNPGPPVAPEVSMSEALAACKAVGNTACQKRLSELSEKVMEVRYTRARLFVIKWFGWIPVLGPRL